MKSSYASGNPITAGAAIQRSIDTLYGGMPGYDKLERTLLDAVWTGTELEQATRGALDAFNAEQGGGAQGGAGLDPLKTPQQNAKDNPQPIPGNPYPPGTDSWQQWNFNHS
jgi:hypothetical protein